jgi:hypothetical protein
MVRPARIAAVGGVVLGAACCALWLSRAPGPPLQPRIRPALADAPLAFEPNVGQAPESVAFTAHRGRIAIVLSSGGAALRAGDRVLRMKLEGAATVPGTGEEPLAARVNYLIGDRPENWHAGLPTYRRVLFRNVYPGVHVVWSGDAERLEYDFLLEPGADPSPLRVSLNGDEVPLAAAAASGQRQVLDPSIPFSRLLGGDAGDSAGAVAVDPLGNYTVVGSTASVNFPVTNSATQVALDGGTDAFVSKFSKPNQPDFSTYLGGSGDDSATAVAMDAQSDVYVAGTTSSTNFPVVGPSTWTSVPAPPFLMTFFTRLNGSGVIDYSHYLGGSGAAVAGDLVGAIAVDSSASIALAGWTGSSNFPTTPGALQRTFFSSFNGFLTRVSPDGSKLDYSTFLGSGSTFGSSLALDSAGNAYVGGETSDVFSGCTPGASHGFLFEVTDAGTAGLSLCISGDGRDAVTSVAVGPTGDVYFCGITSSTTLPATHKIMPAAGFDLVVVRMNPSRGYFTIAGTGLVNPRLAVGPAGEAYIVDSATGPGFPMFNAIQPVNNGPPLGLGGSNILVAVLDPTGSTIPFSTYLGGSTEEDGTGVAVLPSGEILVVGASKSTDFDAGAGQTLKGSSDAFIVEFSQSGLPDGGLSRDGGTAVDGGPPADGGVAADGGPPKPDGGTGLFPDGGVVANLGCASSPGAAAWLAGALAVALGLGLRRRR